MMLIVELLDPSEPLQLFGRALSAQLSASSPIESLANLSPIGTNLNAATCSRTLQRTGFVSHQTGASVAKVRPTKRPRGARTGRPTGGRLTGLADG